jgi:hypothetical protein
MPGHVSPMVYWSTLSADTTTLLALSHAAGRRMVDYVAAHDLYIDLLHDLPCATIHAKTTSSLQ